MKLTHMTIGEQLKAEGMELVLSHTPEGWKLAFEHEGSRIASYGEPFTADDILRVVGLPPVGTSKNAVGAAMNALAWKLELDGVGFVKSTRHSRHGGFIRHWRMRI